MPKAVLTTKVDPSYDDLPEERYHFPRTYLNAARAALGDWIVYYEPRRSSAHLSSSGGRQSYFATARVVRVDGDPCKGDHYNAYVEDYLEFDRPVPFHEDGFFYESGLQKADGSPNKGKFGWAVRLLADAEYSMIVAAGFETGTAERERFVIREGIHPDPGRLELADRPIIERLSRRPFRDRVFSTGIKRAYDNTCAISGLRIIIGGGRAEAQAAHIRPVHANGPDSLWNGVALSSTFHWMFDRGLISIDDDYRLLFKRNAVPGNVHSLVNYARRLTPMFRLREQILNHLTYHIHTHGARPGMIAFRV